jgi:hypothetical protein
MNEVIVLEAEKLLKRIEKLGRFESKYTVFPCKEAASIVDGLNSLVESLPDLRNVNSRGELVDSELKRRLVAEASRIEQRLSGRHYDFDTVIDIHGIPRKDIEELRPWLELNRDDAFESIERLFKTNDVESYELQLPLDVPSIRRRAQENAEDDIHRYHTTLGEMLKQLTEVGDFYSDIRAVPTEKDRSYFCPLTNTLALGIPNIYYLNEDGSLGIRERELIRLYGHEGMGHGLNSMLSESDGLHYFLRKSSAVNESTLESVAQFYERVIFGDVKDSPETQRKLDIGHKFEEIYQDAQDGNRLFDYGARLGQYAISLLGNKDLDYETRVRLLSEVSLDPNFPLGFLEYHKDSFDTQGNPNYNLVSELKYCAQPVKRALGEFEKRGISYEGEGRSLIDKAFLKGFWTPDGFVDNARLISEGK